MVLELVQHHSTEPVGVVVSASGANISPKPRPAAITTRS
jgi:hypothetical protein